MSVWVPDELAAAVKEHLPKLNVSNVLQDGLRQRLRCHHFTVQCADCAETIDVNALVDQGKSAFYTQLLMEIENLINADGTLEGAARVAKSVALSHGLDVGWKPLPRPNQAQRRRHLDALWYQRQAASST